MFGIGPLELVVITIVAVLFIGPDKLPDAMRKFGKFFVQIRRHANDVKGSFQEIIHDAERELELEKIRELQAKLQSAHPGQLLETSIQNAVNQPLDPHAQLHAQGAEPFDYHESHYKDGVYTETGPDHVRAPDPILQPDPPVTQPPSGAPAPLTAEGPTSPPAAAAPAASAPAPAAASPAATPEKKASSEA